MIQIDMEMPKNCADCVMCHPKGKDEPWNYCCFATMDDLNIEEWDKERYITCPLKEVPTGKLERENEALKNRCFVLSGGTMCMFCPIDCDKRNVPFRGVVEEQQGENTDGSNNN